MTELQRVVLLWVCLPIRLYKISLENMQLFLFSFNTINYSIILQQILSKINWAKGSWLKPIVVLMLVLWCTKKAQNESSNTLLKQCYGIIYWYTEFQEDTAK